MASKYGQRKSDRKPNDYDGCFVLHMPPLQFIYLKIKIIIIVKIKQIKKRLELPNKHNLLHNCKYGTY